MDEKRLETIVQELTESLQGEEPCSRVTAGKPRNMLFISANRAGLLSLSKLFLSAALSPPSEGTTRTPPVEIDGHHQEILEVDQDFMIGFIQHESQMPVPEKVAHDRDRESLKRNLPGLVGCAVITMVVGGLLITGLTTWIRFLSGAT